MKEKLTINNVVINYDNTTKFKKNGIYFHFLHDISSSNNLLKTKLLCSILNKETKKYNEVELTLKKYYLNNLAISFYTTEVKNKIDFVLGIHYIDMPFNSNIEIVKEALELASELLFNPKINSKGFEKKLYKKQLKDIIDTFNVSQTQKNKYAAYKFNECLDKDSKLYQSRILSIKDLLKETPKSLYEYYKELISNNLIVNVIGKTDVKLVEEFIKNKFSDVNNYQLEKNVNIYPLNEYKEVSIKDDRFDQGIIYKLYQLDCNKKAFDAILLTSIIGQSNSRLFKYVREEKGLCYSIYGNYLPTYGVFIVNCSTFKDKIDECLKAIDYVMEDIINNGVNQKELDNVKKQATLSLLGIDDDINGIDRYFINAFLDSKPLTIKQKIDKYNKAKIEDVNTVRKYIKKLITFTLR